MSSAFIQPPTYCTLPGWVTLMHYRSDSRQFCNTITYVLEGAEGSSWNHTNTGALLMHAFDFCLWPPSRVICLVGTNLTIFKWCSSWLNTYFEDLCSCREALLLKRKLWSSFCSLFHKQIWSTYFILGHHSIHFNNQKEEAVRYTREGKHRITSTAIKPLRGYRPWSVWSTYKALLQSVHATIKLLLWIKCKKSSLLVKTNTDTELIPTLAEAHG